MLVQLDSSIYHESEQMTRIENRNGDLVLETIDTGDQVDLVMISLLKQEHGKTSIFAHNNGAVSSIKWNNGSKKFETTSTDANVTVRPICQVLGTVAWF